MRGHARSVALVIASSAPWIAACVGGGDDSFVPAPPADASLVDGSREAAATDGTTGRRDAPLGLAGDGGADATTVNALPGPLAGLRVAQWSPDAPPVDFCVAAHGSGVYQGPVLAAKWGDAGGIAFPDASTYSLWPPGQYDVRLVGTAPGTDCSPAGFPEGAGTAPLGPGSTATLALMGEVGSLSGDAGLGLRILSLVDEFVVPPNVSADGSVADVFAVRFIHAAPGVPPVDLKGTSGGSAWSFTGVPFGRANPWKDGGTDAAGYQRVPAVGLAMINVRLSGQDAGVPPLFPAPTLNAAAGSVLTLVLAGTTPMGAAVQLLECVDNAGVTGADSACRTLTVSTCGDGILDPFEECDCGSNGNPKCMSANLGNTGLVGNGVAGSSDQGFSPCSPTCRLN